MVFNCSNSHVLLGTATNSKPTTPETVAPAAGGAEVEVAPKKVVDINEPQVCKNKGCGQTFKEIDNHDTACSYHPGPAVFHDRMRGVRSIPIFQDMIRHSLCILMDSLFFAVEML